MPDETAAPEATAPAQQPQPQPQAGDPVSAVNVKFNGLKRVRPKALIGECVAFNHVETLGDLQDALNDVQTRFGELGVFKNLRADVALRQDRSVDVAFEVDEKARECTASVNCDKKGEMSADLKLVQPALLGGPLSLTGCVGSTATQTQSFLLRLATPRPLGYRGNWSLDLARGGNEEQQASGYAERFNHAVMQFTNPAGNHALSMEAALRDILPATKGPRLPSAEILQAQLRSTKSSVKYSYRGMWSKDVPGFDVPFKASVTGNIEVAGGPCDASFVRGEAQASVTYPLLRHPEVCAHFTGACGVLLPRPGQASFLQDRFFLGGPSGCGMLMKGFAHRGVGPMGACRPRNPNKPPKHLYDALGGDVMFNTFAVVSTPLPVHLIFEGADVGGRAFAFMGTGALAAQARGSDGAFTCGFVGPAAPRLTCGMGIGMPLAGFGTLEFTLSRPVRSWPTDHREKWQMGLRMELRG